MRHRSTFALVLLVACAPSNSSVASTASTVSGSTVGGSSGPISTANPCWEAPPGVGDGGFVDATEQLGMIEPLLGMRAHAGGWGDVNGDGYLDLFVGSFAGASTETFQVRGASGPSPDRLLLGGAGGFTMADSFLDEPTRTSGVAMADLDGDSDLDLVLDRYPRERASIGSVVLENEGGIFNEVAGAGLDGTLAGRSVGVLDFDRDGMLDLLQVADPRGDGSSRLLRNEGDLKFSDVTDTAFVEGVLGLGVTTADLNGDSYTDVFVGGSNRLFVGTHEGTLREVESDVFDWEVFGPEDDVAGVAIADLNRDGRPDVVVGHHFNSTLNSGSLVPVRVYLNDGAGVSGDPTFNDVTDEAGMPGMATKAPHVEIVDFDNDGWPDILTTASAGDGPAIFRHEGLVDGVPRFSSPPGLGTSHYWVTGPTADVNRDGRTDVFLAEWEPALPSLMLLNDAAGGNWLSVEIDAAVGGGVGAAVSIYEAGQSASPASLVGLRDIAVSVGYAAGSPPWAHFGLGSHASVDVRVVVPDGRTYSVDGVPANRHVILPDGCGGGK
ncbi:MAG TPA: CRTAC1 family protein [Acidimicrobiia bacterium]|nr:CRTAC1 family protein [Acidimicrobiia bacterium]